VEPYTHPGSGDFISYYRVWDGGTVRDYPVEDIVHFRNGINIRDTRKGQAPLYSLMREVATDNEITNFTSALLRNFGVAPVIISPADKETTVTPADGEAMKQMFTDAVAGDNRGKALVAPVGVRVDKLGFDPQQLNLNALHRIPEERVSAVLKIPAIVAGLGAGLERSTYSNTEQAEAMAWRHNIQPTQNLMASDADVQLLVDFASDTERMTLYCGFDNSKVPVLQESANELAKRANEGVQAGVWTLEEGRRAQNLKTGPQDDYFLRSSSLVVVGRDGQPKSPELPQEDATTNTVEGELVNRLAELPAPEPESEEVAIEEQG
jgi:phage portal protein BeeE